MRRQLILAIVALQVLALASVVYKRESLLANGTEVLLRTAPVDPRDPFRGDFVVLDYEIGVVATSQLPQQIVDQGARKRRYVYVSLAEGAQGVASVTKVTLSRPESGVYLRGSVGDTRYWSGVREAEQIKYGVEKLFVEQGAGLEIEEVAGQRDSWQTPMDVVLAVGSDGTAAIKRWQWSDISFRFELLEADQMAVTNEISDDDVNPQRPLSPRFTFAIKNNGNVPWDFYDVADNCAFQLLNENSSATLPVHSLCEGKAAREADRLTLRPGDEQQWSFDMADPRWHIHWLNQQGPIGGLIDWPQFRMAYFPPKNLAELTHPERVWDSAIYSPRFTNNGSID